MPALAAEPLCMFVAIPYGAERSREGTLSAGERGERALEFLLLSFAGTTGLPAFQKRILP